MNTSLQDRLHIANQALERLVEQSYDMDLDLPAFVQLCTKTLSSILDIERAGVWLFNEEKSAIHSIDLYLESARSHTSGAMLAADEFPDYFEALRRKRAVIVNDAHTDPRTKQLGANYLTPNRIRAVLDIPIRSGAEIRGVVSCESVESERTWEEHDITFAGSVADILSICYEVAHRKAIESERHEIRRAFGRYVSDDIIVQIMENPEKLNLGGETRELTVMFCDIRNFTGVSEKLNSPARVIALMNDFLTPMSDVIMGLRGTIDKYIGDAIMAFWNAPLDNAAHAVDSCRAALQMKHALAPVNAAIAQNAKQQGIEHFTLRAGIGLNSGLCAVGNMGSRRRFSYSALGDAVNLAARLEKQTRFYGVDIIIGEATLASVRAQGAAFAVLELDRIQVQGKANVTTIYALLGDESFAKTDDFLALQAPHNALIAHYQQGDFIKAKESLEACKPLALDEMLEVYLIYEQRLDALLREPPEGAWSGIYVPESK